MGIGLSFILLLFPYPPLDSKAKMRGINPYYNKRDGDRSQLYTATLPLPSP
nr:MAG TPA: hypothetical protein [Caudoviricetes sp.]